MDMTLTKEQIEAIRKAFPDAWDTEDESEPCEFGIRDLLSGTPEVEIAFAWGAGEPYPISIYGVPGAYYASAPEFDDLGVFSTLEDARRGMDERWDGVCLFGTEEEAWSWAKAEGVI